jgi:2-polyprenyl-3-methyl-5-hydroxy-6-metoxy-1,4-benzoquinol methylase
VVGSDTRPAACPSCARRGAHRLWTLRFAAHPGPFRLWACEVCGVVFHWPRLPAEAISGQYGSDYYIFSLPPARRWSRAAQLYLELLLPLEKPPGRRLLEVGCAQGDLLAIARHRGWDVHGLEISPEPARRATAEYGVPVEIGTLEEQGAHLGLFDVAIATDVIEHVTSPRRFLEAMRAALVPGGRAILETPNAAGLWSRLGGRRWIGYNRFHLFLFGPGSLVRLMRACGFRDCRAWTTTHAAHVLWGHRPELDALVRHLPAALRWRATRGLNRITPGSRALDLWLDPPTSLSEALERIETYRARAAGPRRRRLSGDNLAVVGRA